MSSLRWLGALAVAAGVAFGASAAHAEEPALPATLSMEETLRIVRVRSFDVLLADASIVHAEGDVLAAGAVANPSVSFAAGPAINYTPPANCVGCDRYGINWGLTDNGAVFDVITGKRGLRKSTAEALLAAARTDRVDASRVVVAETKQAYLAIVVGRAELDFARDVQESLSQTLELNRRRYPAVINEGELARTELQKASADQVVIQATAALRQAQLALGFLLGAREIVPDFQVDKRWLKATVPAELANATEASLYARALANRPDVKATAFRRDAADEALRAARRGLFPDVSLSLNYSQFGTGPDAAQPPTLLFGLTLTLPVVYQQQGEVRRAGADVDAQRIASDRVAAVVANEISDAFASFQRARAEVAQYESLALDRAKRARDVVETQYKAGSAPLMDYLDAERTYITTNLQYLEAIERFWDAVFQLERALGAEVK
jgi:cobalt-zinc-cadmium efflux system outer membrane protein